MLILVVARVASALVRPVGRGVVSADATQSSLVRAPAVVATSRAGAQECPAVSRWGPPRALVGLRITGHRDRWEDQLPVRRVQVRLAPALWALVLPVVRLRVRALLALAPQVVGRLRRGGRRRP